MILIIKKQNKYVAFFSIRTPADISTDKTVDDISGAEGEGDAILIKISRPFSDDTGSMLFNFINFITKEYQI